MANLSGEHWKTIKMILRYIREISNVALYYGGSEYTIKSYMDLDFIGNLVKRKSTNG